MDKIKEMREAVARLNEAGKAYYQDSVEIMTNLAYDELYDRLVVLEEETGIVLGNSPTQKVGYETRKDLPKEAHDTPMLSLDKTKSVEELVDFAGDHSCILSWKLDGITIVLTYEGGRLVKAVTRGNGEIGEVVTPNAMVFANLPVIIPEKSKVVLRGEAVITYSDFEKINEELPELDAKYKNPRNLCSGSVRQLNNEITARRNVRFVAFSMVNGPGETMEEQLLWLASQGFEAVEYRMVSGEDMGLAVKEFQTLVTGSDYPSDGLVLSYNDIAYGKSLGSTSKSPRGSIAFKWEDEISKTVLLYIEWSTSRTGLINPIAVFEPVELEGTTVSRAGVHNLSILKDLALGIGDEIEVYKANMIIPQIAGNNTRSGPVEIPSVCPVCGGVTEIKNDNGVETLYCINPDCPAKKIKTFAMMTGRDALNIEGLSEMTLEKFTGNGIIREPADFFKLEEHSEEIRAMEGFGEKSYKNLVLAAEKARRTTSARLLYSLGIPGIGVAGAKLIARHQGDDFAKMRALTEEELMEIEGIGEVLASSYVEYFSLPHNNERLDNLLEQLILYKQGEDKEQNLEGMTFVITGSLEHFANREALKEEIELRGGKVAGSVSGKTSFLINNDVASSSTKNKKAASLQIPILSEEEFMERFGIHGKA